MCVQRRKEGGRRRAISARERFGSSWRSLTSRSSCGSWLPSKDVRRNRARSAWRATCCPGQLLHRSACAVCRLTYLCLLPHSIQKPQLAHDGRVLRNVALRFSQCKCPQTFDPSFLAVRCFSYVPGNGRLPTLHNSWAHSSALVISRLYLALVRGSVFFLLECSAVLVLHRVAGRSVCQSHA